MIAETYDSIQHRLGLQQNLPYTPDWSAAPDFLAIILNHCLEKKPETIVECSSGLTTLVLSRCCQLNGHGHVTSLENDAKYAAQTRSCLDEFGLGQYATVMHAPLVKRVINNRTYEWYDTGTLCSASIDMLVIDGPPGFIQQHSRYPALPALFEKLSAQSAVFLDDAARQDEKEIVEFWQKDFRLLEHEYVETERGCAVLKITRSGF